MRPGSVPIDKADTPRLLVLRRAGRLRLGGLMADTAASDSTDPTPDTGAPADLVRPLDKTFSLDLRESRLDTQLGLLYVAGHSPIYSDNFPPTFVLFLAAFAYARRHGRRQLLLVESEQPSSA